MRIWRGNGSGIGEAIKVDTLPATVIGVVADGYEGLQSDGTFDLIVPFAVTQPASGSPSDDLFRSKQVVGRLAPGASIETARAELLALWPSRRVTASSAPRVEGSARRSIA